MSERGSARWTRACSANVAICGDGKRNRWDGVVVAPNLVRGATSDSRNPADPG